MADSNCEAIEKAMAEAGPEKDGSAGAAVPPVQSLRFVRSSGTENEAKSQIIDSSVSLLTASAVPGQVLSPEVGPQLGDAQIQGQGPPPQKAAPPTLATPNAEKDLHWQRHQEHLAYLKSLGSEAYKMAVEDTGGASASPAKDSEVAATTCASTQGPELLDCLSVSVKHLFDEKDDYSRETSMVEKHLDEAIAEVTSPPPTEKAASPRPLTTPGRGVRDVLKMTPTTVENWSQVEDREIWDKLRSQLQSLEDSVGELTRKTMPKRRTGGDLTASHPSWPKDAGMPGFFQVHRASFPQGPIASRRSSRETMSEHSSSDVSSSYAKGHSSMASAHSRQYAEQGSMEPEVHRDSRCVQLSCRSDSSGASVPQLPTPCSAKIMAPEVIGTPSMEARTPATGRSVYRQISSPVALLTPRIAGEVRTIMTPVAGYPQ